MTRPVLLGFALITGVLAFAIWLGWSAWSGDDASGVEINPAPGFKSGSIRGTRIEVRVRNSSEAHSLRRLDLECTLRLKNGNPADTIRFRLAFPTPIPPRSDIHVRHPLEDLKYHVNDYQAGPRGLSCRPVSARLKGEMRTDSDVVVTDSHCSILRTWRDDRARIQVRNHTNQTIKEFQVRCWSGTRWRTLTGIHRPRAPLDELLPPGSTEWLQFDPPCLNNYTDASSCRVSRVRTKR